MNEPFHVHDFRNDYRCYRLFARKVWQVLFNEYRANGGNLDRMDNLLCDLYGLQARFEKNQSFAAYWDCANCATWLYDEWSMIANDCIEIRYDKELGKVSFYHRTFDEMLEVQS